MQLLGLIRYAIVLGTWIYGAICVPLAIALYFIYNMYIHIYIIIIYYSFRAIFPPDNWPFWINNMCLNEHPYFNRQDVIFDNGAKPPAPNSKVLITMSPHGILTLG